MRSDRSDGLKSFRADLHLHTVLSPCAAVEMIPPLIVGRAIEVGLDVIAVTDHNSTGNVAAVQEAAEGTPLRVLAGMELQTAEEVHLVCLFDSAETATGWEKEVRAAMPVIHNTPDSFGEQFVVDSTGDFIRREEQLLIVSADIQLDEAVERVHALGGLAIPAHVNRTAFGIIGNLGLIPPLDFDALEITPFITPEEARKRLGLPNRYTLICSSDAHSLHEIRQVATVFGIKSRTLEEMRLALRGEGGRTVRINVGN